MLFRSEMLRFAPSDFEKVSYNRERAVALARDNPDEYQRYMAAVFGTPMGEWPKLKFDSSCQSLVASLGAVRRDVDTTNAYGRALMIGMCAPASVKSKVVEMPAEQLPRAVGFQRRRIGGRRF